MEDVEIQDQLEQISQQLATMIHHVAEIRSSNTRIEKQLCGIESPMDALETRMDTLANEYKEGKRIVVDRMERLVEVVGGDVLRSRVRQQIELDEHKEAVQSQLQGLEVRISCLETAQGH